MVSWTSRTSHLFQTCPSAASWAPLLSPLPPGRTLTGARLGPLPPQGRLIAALRDSLLFLSPWCHPFEARPLPSTSMPTGLGPNPAVFLVPALSLYLRPQLPHSCLRGSAPSPPEHPLIAPPAIPSAWDTLPRITGLFPPFYSSFSTNITSFLKACPDPLLIIHSLCLSRSHMAWKSLLSISSEVVLLLARTGLKRAGRCPHGVHSTVPSVCRMLRDGSWMEEEEEEAAFLAFYLVAALPSPHPWGGL